MARLEKIGEQESVLIDSREISEQTPVRGKALQIVPLPWYFNDIQALDILDCS